MSLKIYVIPALKDNFAYALSAPDGQCAIVDPSEYSPIAKFLEAQSLHLTHILCTHHHWDHIEGLPELLKHHQVEVWTSHTDRERIPGSTRGLREGESLKLFGEDLNVIEVPGHTLGQICFWLPKQKAVFVGDTVFSLGVGRLFEGSYEQMFSSLAKIKQLPVDTQIYFGHEYTLRSIQFLTERGDQHSELTKYKFECEDKLRQGIPTSPTTLERELRLNPFLAARDIEELRRWREARNDWKN